MNLLNSEKVEYLIVGGYAVSYYGYIRATGDIDIWISKEKENALKVIKCLKEFGFNDKDLKLSYFTEDDQVTRFGVPPLRVEILTTISGVDFNDCYKRKNIITIDDIKLYFIDLEDLKKNKSAAKRYKDLDDLENLQ